MFNQGNFCSQLYLSHRLLRATSLLFLTTLLSQARRTALRQWIWNLSTSRTLGALRITVSSTGSIIHCTRPNDLPLSTLTRSSHNICTSTTPTRKTNGGTRGVIVFSTTHMPTRSFQKAGKRKMVSRGHGIYNLFLLWSEKQPLHFPHKFSQCQNKVNCSVPSQY